MCQRHGRCCGAQNMQSIPHWNVLCVPCHDGSGDMTSEGELDMFRGQ